MATKLTFEQERKKLLKNAFVPPELNFDLAGGESETSLSEIVHPIASSFEYNLSEAVNLASLPFNTAKSITLENLWNRTVLAEKIRSRSEPEKHDGTEFEDEVFHTARSKFEEVISHHERTASDDEYDFLYDIVDRANSLIANGPMKDVARTVLLQAEVMVWNSLEILVRDIMEAGMNSSPEMRHHMASSDEIVSKWNLKRVNLHDISDFDFDLKRNFGTVILSGREISDISTIKLLTSSALGKDTAIDKLLSDKSLYQLSKRRHLIVHRQAKIDKKFLAEVQSNQKVGEKLFPSPESFEECLKLSYNAGKAIILKVNEYTR